MKNSSLGPIHVEPEIFSNDRHEELAFITIHMVYHHIHRNSLDLRFAMPIFIFRVTYTYILRRRRILIKAPAMSIIYSLYLSAL